MVEFLAPRLCGCRLSRCGQAARGRWHADRGRNGPVSSARPWGSSRPERNGPIRRRPEFRHRRPTSGTPPAHIGWLPSLGAPSPVGSFDPLGTDREFAGFREYRQRLRYPVLKDRGVPIDLGPVPAGSTIPQVAHGTGQLVGTARILVQNPAIVLVPAGGPGRFGSCTGSQTCRKSSTSTVGPSSFRNVPPLTSPSATTTPSKSGYRARRCAISLVLRARSAAFPAPVCARKHSRSVADPKHPDPAPYRTCTALRTKRPPSDPPRPPTRAP